MKKQIQGNTHRFQMNPQQLNRRKKRIHRKRSKTGYLNICRVTKEKRNVQHKRLTHSKTPQEQKHFGRHSCRPFSELAED